jgi:hypothetical protein
MPWGFLAGSAAVWEPSEPVAEVPYRLYRDGVRSFGLFPGIAAAELARFVDALARSDSQLSAEDDRVTLLGSAHFEHVAFRSVAAVAAEAADPRQAAARQRLHIVALAAFDTTAQLEECWQDGHQGKKPVELEPIVREPERADAGARHALEVRFVSEASEVADRIMRTAQASLNVCSRAGAELEVAHHMADQLEPLANAVPERALELCRSIITTLGGTDELSSWLTPATIGGLLRESSSLSDDAIATLIELIAVLGEAHADALRDALPNTQRAELRAAIEQALERAGPA